MTELEQRTAVVAEALSWLRTPYHHQARVKGVGVDCAMLLCEVYERAGVVPYVDPGDYAPQWGLHRDDELYLEHLQASGAQLVQTPGLGDVGAFRFGRTFSHAGILVDRDLVLHAYIGAHVMLTRLSEAPLCDREVRFYSLWKA